LQTPLKKHGIPEWMLDLFQNQTSIMETGITEGGKNMIASRFIDESFDTTNCQNYTLSIQCSLNGFSLLVFDPVTNKFIALVEQEFIVASPFELKNELDLLFKNEPILNYTFKKVKATFLDKRSVIIPDQIIGEADWDDLYYFTFDKKRDEQVLRNVVVPNTSSILFSVPGLVYRCIKNQFPDCGFFATPLPIINFGLKHKSTYPQFLVSKFGDLLLVCFISDQKIHFINHFYVKNYIDCLYYILSVSKKLNINPKAELKLFGKIELQSDLIESLKNYFEKVDFARIGNRYSLSQSFPNVPDHFRLPHLELTLCE
jgi:hypothetical protein